MRKVLHDIHEHFYLDVLALFFLLLSFLAEPLMGLITTNNFYFNPFEQVFLGFYKILISPSILLTDYVYIAGIGATLFNASTILIFNLIIVRILKLKMNGPVFAGIVMIFGFSFFGKNIFNTLPIYFGIYLFSLYKKIPYKYFIITILFSTGISPLVSTLMFGLDIKLFISIPLGILSGIIVGFILPSIVSHTIIFHEGYNLFNTGFALGIISAVFFGILTLLNFDVNLVHLYEYKSSYIFYFILGFFSVGAIILAFINDKNVFGNYLKILKTNGRLISDYVTDYGKESVMLNMGILGIILTILCLIFKIPLNGIVFGSIFSILGFAGFGLHIRNVAPVWVGAMIAILIGCIVRNDYNLSISMIVAWIFSCALAPIAGKYGIVWGLLSGILHICLTPVCASFHGGFDLYNNGFSAGFVAAIISTVADKVFLKRSKNERRESKDM